MTSAQLRLGGDPRHRAAVAPAAAGGRLLQAAFALYLVAFFAYMFLPLLFMSVAAFNAASNPSLIPWRGFTLGWFAALVRDQQMIDALVSSAVIGAGVVLASVPIGLAGALLLVRLRSRARSFVYGLLVSPILIPGIILGISTLILWDLWGVPGGLFLSVVGQTTYVASYCMLLFLARLQRFDLSLEEAALDLGAPHHAVFRDITLPFLRPAILTAAALAFLQSVESYNTALFTIGNKTTLTVFIAAKVRLGLTPAVNALGVALILATILLAVLYELRRRRPGRARAAAAPSQRSA